MHALLLTLTQIIALCRKEFLALFKDPANRVTLFVPAFLQAMLFGYGATYDIHRVPYAVLDHSHGPAAHALLARIDGGGVFQRVATLDGTAQIAGVVDEEAALLVLVVPPDFDARLAAGKEAPLQLILDGRNSSTAGLAAAYLNGIIADFNRAQPGAVTLVEVERRAWYNPNLVSRWTIMTALIAVLSMMQTLLLAALSVAREREQGTFDQLLVTPLTPMQILIGKALPAITVGLAQSTIILLIVMFWFHIPMAGSLVTLYAGLLMFTLASVGLGLSISALSLNMQQAMLYTFVLIMPLILLSGMISSVRNMPMALQIATYANPLRFGVNISRRVYLEGAGLAEVGPDFIPLIVIAVLTLPLAAWLFRNRLN